MKSVKNVIIYAAWAILAGGILCVNLAHEAVPVPLNKQLAYFPFKIDGWTGVDRKSSEYLASAVSADDIMLRGYANAGGDSLELYAAYFNYTKDKKTPHAPQLCWVGSGWTLKDLGEETLALDSKKCPSALIKKVLAQKSGEKILLYYTYRINRRYAADLMKFRIMNVLDTVIKGKNSAFTLQLSAPVGDEGRSDKESRMKEFLSKALSVAENEFLP